MVHVTKGCATALLDGTDQYAPCLSARWIVQEMDYASTGNVFATKAGRVVYVTLNCVTQSATRPTGSASMGPVYARRDGLVLVATAPDFVTLSMPIVKITTVSVTSIGVGHFATYPGVPGNALERVFADPKRKGNVFVQLAIVANLAKKVSAATHVLATETVPDILMEPSTVAVKVVIPRQTVQKCYFRRDME